VVVLLEAPPVAGAVEAAVAEAGAVTNRSSLVVTTWPAGAAKPRRAFFDKRPESSVVDIINVIGSGEYAHTGDNIKD
jgi:hypothetical protein